MQLVYFINFLFKSIIVFLFVLILFLLLLFIIVVNNYTELYIILNDIKNITQHFMK